MTATAFQSFATAFATAATNPVPLVVVTGVAVFAVWKVASSHFSGRIAILDDRLKLKDDQLAAVARERLVEINRDRPEPPSTTSAIDRVEAVPATLPLSAAPPRGDITTFADGNRVLIKNYTYTTLMDIFAGKTSLQEEAIAAPFLGKWLQLDFEVANIFRRADVITVLAPYPEQMARYAWLTFSKNLGEIEILNIGDRLSAVGEIREVDYLTIRLYECELV